MTREEIIKLGTGLGLKYNPERNYVDDEIKGNYVVFDGVNAQRFLIHHDKDNDDILEELGSALITMGKRMKAMQINDVISITSD